jgi:hypothetical protein
MLLLLAVIGLLLVSTAIRKRFDLWMFGDSWNGDRYFFIPKIILIWIALLLAADRGRPFVRSAAGLLLVTGLVLNSPLYRFKPYTDLGWYALCPDIRAGRKITVKVNSDWTFHYQRHGATDGPF